MGGRNTILICVVFLSCLASWSVLLCSFALVLLCSCALVQGARTRKGAGTRVYVGPVLHGSTRNRDSERHKNSGSPYAYGYGERRDNKSAYFFCTFATLFVDAKGTKS